MEPHCRWKIAHACCRWPLPSCLPNSPPHPTVSCAKQELCTIDPSAGGQPGVTEPLAARPRTPPGLASKSQLSCQATAGGPSGSCLPRPGPPRVRSKPPRPWPGARTSSPAQMPPGSRRVGTCLRPRAGIGTRAARPPHLCLPGSCFSALSSPPPPPARVGSGSCPRPGCSRKPEGRGFPCASTEEVAGGGCGAPRARTGLAFYRTSGGRPDRPR